MYVIHRMIHEYLYQDDKKYDFKSEAARNYHQDVTNSSRLMTNIFVETVNDYRPSALIDDNQLINLIAPAMKDFENFYPINIGIKNMRRCASNDEDYQSKMIRKSASRKGYQGIFMLDNLLDDQDFRFQMPYGNFFSSSEDIIISAKELKGEELKAGDLLLFPKALTVAFPPRVANHIQRFFEFDIVGIE